MKLPDLYPFRKGKLKFYHRVKDIDYVKGDGIYSGFYFIDGKSITESDNIGWHWERLQAFDFLMRIHRSYIVNLKAIRGIDTDGRVILKSGIEVYCALKSLPELLKRYPVIGK